jgi:hypothetical protein
MVRNGNRSDVNKRAKKVKKFNKLGKAFRTTKESTIPLLAEFLLGVIRQVCCLGWLTSP